MKKRSILLLVLAVTGLGIAGFSLIIAQKTPMHTFYELPPGSDYEKEWKKVGELEEKGLTESAQKEVEMILALARKENNEPQQVKALLHLMKYNNYVRDGSTLTNLAMIRSEIGKAQEPLKSVLQSILGQMYWGYYQQNQWELADRTQIRSDELPEDIGTWDLKTVIDQSNAMLLASLEPADTLRATRLEVFDPILQRKEGSTALRPSLYDFLAHQAIEILSNEASGITEPAYKFVLRDENAFAPAERFASLEFPTQDSASRKWKTLKIFQELTAFHQATRNKKAQIDLDLKRLNWVRSNIVHEEKEVRYQRALEGMRTAYSSDPDVVRVYLALTIFHKNQGNAFNPLTGEHKEENKTALEIAKNALQKYPESPYAPNIRNLIAEIEEPRLGAEMAGIEVPGKPGLLHLRYRNLSEVYIRVIKSGKALRNSLRNLNGKEVLEALAKAPVVGKDRKVVLPADPDFNMHEVDIDLRSLELGEYIVLVGKDPKFNYESGATTTHINISNLAFNYSRNTEGEQEIFVFDRTSGEPQASVEVRLSIREYDYKQREYIYRDAGTYKTGKDGSFVFPRKGNSYTTYHVTLAKGPDVLDLDASASVNRRSTNPEKPRLKTVFFMDRKIYRPGQEVFFKGILLRSFKGNTTVVTGQQVSVELMDPNRQKAGVLSLKSNDFGTFSGSFQLPLGGITGRFSLVEKHGYEAFSVEEYKRPRFEAIFEPVKETFRVGDEISVSGKAIAYAGSNIDNARVTYRVVREATFPWWFGWRYPSPSAPSMEITSGEVTTDGSGEFVIKFEAIPDLSQDKSKNPQFNYTVYADVIDITGETHSAQTTVSVGYLSLKASVNIPSQLQKGTRDTFNIHTVNLNGQEVPARGTIRIYRLNPPERILRSRLWGMPDKFLMDESTFHEKFPHDIYKDEDQKETWDRSPVIFEENFDTEKQKSLVLKGMKDWQEGEYELRLETADKFGKEVEFRTLFSLADLASAQPFGSEPFLLFQEKSSWEPGETAGITLSTAVEELWVLVQTREKDQQGTRQWVKMKAGKKSFQFPVKEEHRGGFTISFAAVWNGRFFSENRRIHVPWSNKKLEIEWETFRDKLAPGEKEEWRMKIKGPDGEKVSAEMVAAMYDASLDVFRQNFWSLNVWQSFYSTVNWETNEAFSAEFGYFIRRGRDSEKTFYPEYDTWNFHGFSPGSFGGYYDRGMFAMDEREKGIKVAETAAAPMAGVRSQSGGDLDKMEEESEQKPPAPPDETSGKDGLEGQLPGAEGEKLGEVNIRTNLNETAFFRPHLQTDEAGNIVFSFTVPEALTRWRILTLAHTPDLKTGLATNSLVTQKELMVMPVPPRFFRENDRMTFTAKVSNLSEKDLSGMAEIELLDAQTGKPVNDRFGIKTSRVPFSAKAGQSAPLKWNLTIPEGISAVTWRVKAAAGNFTDGEESSLPVLTNRMLVTESMPLPVRAGESRNFTFTKLQETQSPTLRHHRYTLEFTSNPAWYAVQALPYLMEYPYECSEQIFSRYYANSLASHIANSHPRIKSVFEEWKNAGSDALVSNLEKNQELKSLILEETPWVLQAKDETERKKRIGLLFDLNKMAGELTRAEKQLVKAQTPNGGFPWFPGMRDSRYITQHIVCGFGHLDRLGVDPKSRANQIRNMLTKAVNYLDDRIREDYERLKEVKADLKKDHLGATQIHYLYARSFFRDQPVAKQNREAFDYYLGQAQTYWLEKSRYLQGMIALGLHRNEVTGVPADIIRSLKENSVKDEELGMYWKAKKGWFWYEADIERQALFIEAFEEITQDRESVEEMKLWLLKQKQTQDWKTTRATVEACYALLLRGTDILSESQLAEVTVGGKSVTKEITASGNAEAGTGYFKKAWSGDEITSKMAKVSVKNPNKVAAWGAVYWQYFEQLDKITPAETPLSLKKALFREENSDRGPVLVPVNGSMQLNPGDKVIVRIELRVDREMDYVHMKDMRAAGFEPVNVLSQYKWQDGLGYYESTRDASTNFFFSTLRKGTYVFEYPLRVTYAGDFSNGITSIQCMYAPEFTSHSEGIRVKVQER